MSESIIRIHPPVLSEEERARRMDEIARAAVKVLLASDMARMEHKKKGVRV